MEQFLLRALLLLSGTRKVGQPGLSIGPRSGLPTLHQPSARQGYYEHWVALDAAESPKPRGRGAGAGGWGSELRGQES